MLRRRWSDLNEIKGGKGKGDGMGLAEHDESTPVTEVIAGESGRELRWKGKHAQMSAATSGMVMRNKRTQLCQIRMVAHRRK